MKLIYFCRLTNKFIGGNYLYKRLRYVFCIFLISAICEFFFVIQVNELMLGVSSYSISDYSKNDFFLFLFVLTLTTILKITSLVSSNFVSQRIRAQIGNKLFVNVTPASSNLDKGEELGLLSTELDNLIGYFFIPLFNLVLVLVTVLAISLSIISLYPIAGPIAIFSSILAYGLVSLTTRKFLVQAGERRTNASLKRTSFIESYLNLKISFELSGKTNTANQVYTKYNSVISDSFALSSTFASGPKIVLEFLALGTVALSLAIVFSYDLGYSNTIPLIGTLAIAAIRILPALQMGYQNYTGLLFSRKATTKYSSLLKDFSTQNRLLNKINYENISISKLDKIVTKGYNISSDTLGIVNGDLIHLKGPSGSGKSQILKSILNDRSELELILDGKPSNFKNLKIGYCPQEVAFLNGSIYENISLDLGNLACKNDKKLLKICEICEINEILHSAGIDLNTKLLKTNEGLSGGQMQRVAIARALYSEPNLLIIDEGTSGIEMTLESKILKNIIIELNGLPILITSHRSLGVGVTKELKIL